MATAAIGDIHGNRRALEDLLSKVQAELDVEDTVVFLGDYIDRGPDARGCVDRILESMRFHVNAFSLSAAASGDIRPAFSIDKSALAVGAFRSSE